MPLKGTFRLSPQKFTLIQLGTLHLLSCLMSLPESSFIAAALALGDLRRLWGSSGALHLVPLFHLAMMANHGQTLPL